MQTKKTSHTRLMKLDNLTDLIELLLKLEDVEPDSDLEEGRSIPQMVKL